MSVRIRSFIAIDLEDKIVRSKLITTQGLLSKTGVDLKFVEKENLHLTFKFLGEVSQELIKGIENVLSELRFKPFKAEVLGVGVFPRLTRPRIIWAGFRKGETELRELFKETELRLKKVGIQSERNPFHPHITLARVRSGKNRDLLIRQILELSDEPFGEIKINSLRLKKRILTPRGPIYSTIYDLKAEVD